MRIAYIAPYQGAELGKKRPIARNFSLGTRRKMELIAQMLQSKSHSVEILSQGEVVENRLKFYPGFNESRTSDLNIPVYYSSAFPAKYLNGFWSSLSLLRLFKRRHQASPFDFVVAYNLKIPQVTSANYAIRSLGLRVVLEYEDDQFITTAVSANNRLTSRFYLSAARRLLDSVSGCVSGSSELSSQVVRDVPKLLLCGVVSEAIVKATAQNKSGRKNWVVFSGTHSWAQGLEQLINAWELAKLPGWQLHIAGQGHLTATLEKLAGNNPSIVFHGLLNPDDNARLLASGQIAVVPYDVSQTRGFSFKTVECLGAGMHVISTPLIALEALTPQIRAGITYIQNNSPETIAACLIKVIAEGRYEQTAQEATLEVYGPTAVANSLDTFLHQVTTGASLKK